MKRVAAGCVVLATLVTSTALAAELPLPPPALPGPSPGLLRMPTIYDWTGFYLGVNGGGAWGTSDQSQVLAHSQTTRNFGVSGGLVGGTTGFNLQIDRAVFGLEGDLDWTHITGTATCRISFECATQSDYLVTARGRLGYAFLNSWLVYVTGGAALGNIDQSFSPPVGTSSGTNSNRVGWTAGGGLEIALWNTSWSAKAEYLYVNLGTFNCTLACSGIVGQITTTKLIENLFRVGVNYRF
jgi:outer membrane immunogenic protein